MRTLPLVLLAVAALVAPSAAFAGAGSTPTARSFVITGLVLGDQKAEASGKLGIDGSQLSASVGCNLIGGMVTVDGDTITISEPLAMTEMACSGATGDLEAMLIKILQRGPFQVSATAWSGDGAAILVQELASGVPGPRTGAPDEPVTSSPAAVIVDPAFSCPPAPSGVTGGSGASDGSTGSGGAAAAGTEGSSGRGTAPASTAIAEPGTASSPGEEPPAPPAPPASAEPAPTYEPGQQLPEPSAVIVEPAPSAIAVPDPGTITDPGATHDPDPGFNGSPVPFDPCLERMDAVDQGNTAGGAGIVPPKAGDAAAEHAVNTSNPNAPFVALGLVLLAMILVAVAMLRRRQARALAQVELAGGDTVTSLDGPSEGSGPTPR